MLPEEIFCNRSTDRHTGAHAGDDAQDNGWNQGHTQGEGRGYCQTSCCPLNIHDVKIIDECKFIHNIHKTWTICRCVYIIYIKSSSKNKTFKIKLCGQSSTWLIVFFFIPTKICSCYPKCGSYLCVHPHDTVNDTYLLWRWRQNFRSLGKCWHFCDVCRVQQWFPQLIFSATELRIVRPSRSKQPWPRVGKQHTCHEYFTRSLLKAGGVKYVLLWLGQVQCQVLFSNSCVNISTSLSWDVYKRL